jgi:hypothetical protein
LGERFNGIEEVGGSIPPGSTNNNKHLSGNPGRCSFLGKQWVSSERKIKEISDHRLAVRET